MKFWRNSKWDDDWQFSHWNSYNRKTPHNSTTSNPVRSQIVKLKDFFKSFGSFWLNFITAEKKPWISDNFWPWLIILCKYLISVYSNLYNLFFTGKEHFDVKQDQNLLCVTAEKLDSIKSCKIYYNSCHQKKLWNSMTFYCSTDC